MEIITIQKDKKQRSRISKRFKKKSNRFYAPIAVIPEYQRRGIGGQLIRYGIDKASALQFKSVIVLGHEHYYPKFGFVPAEKWNIKSPYNVPTNVFMALELVDNGLHNIYGLVKYPKEFETL